MRKLKAYVHIHAKVETVRHLALDSKDEWMVTRVGPWIKTLAESWEATEAADGTRFALRVEYTSPLPFLEVLLADRLQDSVACSLDRLKHMAEDGQLRH